MARLGLPRCGVAWQAWQGRARLGLARRGTAGKETGTAPPRRGTPHTQRSIAMPENDPIIQIDRIPAETLLIPIIGTAPLVIHRFSEKAKQQMLDAMQGRKTPKQPKD